MHCPFCSTQETKVIDSRLSEDGVQVKRRRECLHCQERFTTFETADFGLPRIIKRDGSRSNFNVEKLRAGILRALEKRPVSTEQIDRAVNQITHDLRASGEREANSALVGEMVMKQLKNLDQVAYVRFASVYRCFQDVSEFHVEIEKLKNDKQET